MYTAKNAQEAQTNDSVLGSKASAYVSVEAQKQTEGDVKHKVGIMSDTSPNGAATSAFLDMAKQAGLATYGGPARGIGGAYLTPEQHTSYKESGKNPLDFIQDLVREKTQGAVTPEAKLHSALADKGIGITSEQAGKLVAMAKTQDGSEPISLVATNLKPGAGFADVQLNLSGDTIKGLIDGAKANSQLGAADAPAKVNERPEQQNERTPEKSFAPPPESGRGTM